MFEGPKKRLERLLGKFPKAKPLGPQGRIAKAIMVCIAETEEPERAALLDTLVENIYVPVIIKYLDYNDDLSVSKHDSLRVFLNAFSEHIKNDGVSLLVSEHLAEVNAQLASAEASLAPPADPLAPPAAPLASTVAALEIEQDTEAVGFGTATTWIHDHGTPIIAPPPMPKLTLEETISNFLV